VGYGAMAEKRRELAHQGRSRDRERSTRTALVGDREGDKRSIVEINADEIGPSLKWATAVVTRTPRAEGSNFQSSDDRPRHHARMNQQLRL